MSTTTSAVREPTTARRWQGSGRWILVAIFVVLAVVGAAMVYPFLWLVISSFKTSVDIVTPPVQFLPRQWTFEGYRYVWEQTSLPRAYANSLGLSAAVVLSVLFTASLAGFVFARLDFPGREIVFYFILSTTMIPFITLFIPLYLVMQRLGLVNTFAGVWLPAAVSSFGIFLCRQFIYSVPQDLYDAGKMDGCGDWANYWRITLPLIKPVLAAQAIFSFLSSFNMYLWPLVMFHDEDKYTLPLILAQLSQTQGINYEAMMTGSVLTSVPSLLVFSVFQRNFVRGIALTGLKV